MNVRAGRVCAPASLFTLRFARFPNIGPRDTSRKVRVVPRYYTCGCCMRQHRPWQTVLLGRALSLWRAEACLEGLRETSIRKSVPERGRRHAVISANSNSQSLQTDEGFARLTTVWIER